MSSYTMKSLYKIGEVLWFRPDKTGYIQSGEDKFYIDSSECLEVIGKGSIVSFIPKNILGKQCATKVLNYKGNKI